VLVSDIGLPGEDGLALIHAVRRLPEAQGGRLPAAALTAYAREQDRVEALRAGFQAHVAKPIQPTDLVRIVASLAGELIRR
jgi:CheY-like chemotaxis protein